MRPVTSSGLVACDRLVGHLAATTHHHHPIANRENVGHAMADEHDRHAGILEAADEIENLGDLPHRYRRGGLVHQHHARLREPRAGDRDRLPLAARHLPHKVAGPGLGFELAEQFPGALGHRLMVEPTERPRAALDLAAEEHIGRRGQIVAEREVLVDDLDPLLARLDGFVKMHRLAADADLAMGRGEIAGDDLDQGRLAGAVVAHEPQDFAESSVRSTSFSAWMAPKCLDTDCSSRIGNPASSASAHAKSAPRPSGAAPFMLLFSPSTRSARRARGGGAFSPSALLPADGSNHSGLRRHRHIARMRA